MIFLAADIGGTRARLLLGTRDSEGWSTLHEEHLASGDFAGLTAVLADFLTRAPHAPEVACIAAAGPVRDDCAQWTNLPWQAEATAVAQYFGWRKVRLINDFSAQAAGLAGLPPAALITLQDGRPQSGAPHALIGAGTGLGVAIVTYARHGEAIIVPSEGGHMDFAPADAEQRALAEALTVEHAHLCLEDVVSGHGLARIDAYLQAQSGERPGVRDAPAIVAAARAGEPIAQAALGLFARCYLSAAGNLALLTLAGRGVFLCGSIAATLLPYLQQPDNLLAFRNKPPMQSLLADIPLHVVLDEQLGLRGAAQLACRL